MYTIKFEKKFSIKNIYYKILEKKFSIKNIYYKI